LATISRWKLFYLLYLSRPKQNRAIYKKIQKGGITKVLELGLDLAGRTQRMLTLAIARAEGNPGLIRYTGVDAFETRTACDGPGVTLKEAYRQLRPSGAKIQLLPGNPFSALSPVADRLGQFDLIVVSADVLGKELSRAWFYVPRLLHADTKVYVENLESGEFRLLSAKQIARLATAAITQRKAA
jgi:hypothetical protein